MDKGSVSHAAGTSSQGRNAWNTPLRNQPQSQASAAIKMPVKNPPLSFTNQPALADPIYSSSDEDSESGGEGGARGRDVDALESAIMADYPTTEDIDDTGVAFLLRTQCEELRFRVVILFRGLEDVYTD